MNKLACIHGVSNGKDPGNFAGDLVRALPDGVAYCPIVWAPIADEAARALDTVTDYVADVFVYRRYWRKVIMDSVEAQLSAFQPDVVVAHSLGTVILFDLILRWAKRCRPRPFKKCVMLASPLTVDIPGHPKIGYTNRLRAAKALNIPAVNAPFFFDLDDPIVHGRLWGRARENQFTQHQVLKDLGFTDRPVESGFHLFSHTAIWGNSEVVAHVEESLKC